MFNGVALNRIILNGVALNKSMFQFLNTEHQEHLFLNLIVYFLNTNENK